MFYYLYIEKNDQPFIYMNYYYFNQPFIVHTFFRLHHINIQLFGYSSKKKLKKKTKKKAYLTIKLIISLLQIISLSIANLKK